MREIIEYFTDKNILFPKFDLIDNKKLDVKSKIKIYKAIDLKNNYCAILHISRKSRFLQKDANNMEDAFHKLKQNLGHNFAKKMIFIQAPLCSKAKILLQSLKWKVFL